jgi:hypothetical protein
VYAETMHVSADNSVFIQQEQIQKCIPRRNFADYILYKKELQHHVKEV